MPRVLSRFQSIRSKLIFIAVCAVLLAVGLASVASGWLMANKRYDAMLSQLDGVAATLATAVAPAQAAGDYHQVMRTLGAIGRMPKVEFAQIIDTNGDLIAEFGNGVLLDDDADALDTDKRPSLLRLLQARQLLVKAPIVQGGENLASLILIADVSDLRSVLFDSIVTTMALGVFAAFAAILLALRLESSVTAPIVSLAKAMREIKTDHDYAKYAVKRVSSDETGDLVDSFNTMLRDIHERDAALVHHRNTLEQTVEARTSELREATDLAQQANAAKSDFLATMSHEIRTPMNGLLVTAELLSASGLPPKLQRYADVIASSGKSLLAIINDILDFSKIEAGKLELEAIPIRPRKLVDEVTRLFGERAASKSLDISGWVDADVPDTIIADPVRLHQVLANLVNNALKFTETGGVMIQISRASAAQETDGCPLSFSVLDTGIGIPEDRLSAIFDAFTQADQTTTRKFGGTGIGLAICQRLASAMSGRIEVESRVGEGSRFSLVADFAVTTVDAADKEKTSRPDASGAKKIVLTIPGGPTRTALEAVAQGRGFTILGADVVIDETHASDDAVVAIIGKAPLPALSVLEDRPIARIAIDSYGQSIGESGKAAPGATARSVGRLDARLGWPVCHDEVDALFDALITGDWSALSNATANEATPPSRRQFTGVRVLAADDSAVNREVLTEALRRLGVETINVPNGKAALEAVQAETYDLVFMDGSMPVMDGFEATRSIRAHEETVGGARLPIVALTAHVVGPQAEVWRDSGMDDCVTKPFTIDILERCLATWLPHLATQPEPADDNAMAAHDTSAHSDSQSAPPTSTGEHVRDVAHDPSGGDTQLIDESILQDIAAMGGDDFELINRVIGLYRLHAPDALSAINGMWGSGDDLEIAEAVHALKSLSRNIGALRVGDLCDEIETAARDQTLVRDASMLNDLEQALTATIDALPAAGTPTTIKTARAS